MNIATPVITDEFKQSLSKWVELDDKIREGKSTLKILEGQRDLLTNKITKYMKSQRMDELNIGTSKIKAKITPKLINISQSFINNRINQFFSSDPETANKLFEFITDINARKTSEETIDLKRSFFGT